MSDTPHAHTLTLWYVRPLYSQYPCSTQRQRYPLPHMHATRSIDRSEPRCDASFRFPSCSALSFSARDQRWQRGAAASQRHPRHRERAPITKGYLCLLVLLLNRWCGRPSNSRTFLRAFSPLMTEAMMRTTIIIICSPIRSSLCPTRMVIC